MKKTVLFLFVFCLASTVFAQQLPYFTQYKSNQIFFNPAITGTKRIVDLRLSYRNQWVGFGENPKTKGISLNSRLLKGMMGVGALYYTDVTGPTRRNFYQGSYAFHIRKPDVEISIGLAVHQVKYEIDALLISVFEQDDPSIIPSALSISKKTDANAGFYAYNDRFHFGIALLDLAQSRHQHFNNKANIYFVPHTFASFGYNWSGHPDYVWENSIMANYVSGAPFQVDYNLKLHIKESFFVGTSIRRKDAIAAHLGINILEEVQFSYSFDFGLSKLKSFHSNSHEVHLVWSTNLPYLLKNSKDAAFKKRKYGYYF